MVRMVVVLLFFQYDVVGIAVFLLFDHLRGDTLAAREEVFARRFAFSDDVVGIDIVRLALGGAFEASIKVAGRHLALNFAL